MLECNIFIAISPSPLHAFHRNLIFFVNLFLREQINAMNIERGFYVEVINRDFNLSGIKNVPRGHRSVIALKACAVIFA